MATSPWSSAIKSSVEQIEKMTYPDLKGMRAMILIPNDHYHKKLMAMGPGYVATTLLRMNIDVHWEASFTHA